MQTRNCSMYNFRFYLLRTTSVGHSILTVGILRILKYYSANEYLSDKDTAHVAVSSIGVI